MEVYFDDLTITQIKSPVVEITDYYPGGAIASTSARESFVPNTYSKFQETEWQADLGVNLYDFDFRQYDPFTLRTTSQDPDAESYTDVSPYSFLSNNPINTLDPDGMDAIGLNEEKEKQSENFSTSTNEMSSGGSNLPPVNARCDNCPNTPEYDKYRNDPGNWFYDEKSGSVTQLLDEVQVTANVPSHAPYSTLEYFWTGGFEDGVKYNRDGKYMSSGWVIGEAPDVGLGKGVKALKHLHHSFPKFLGGLKNQKLTKMSADLHKALHKELNAFLRRFGMAPSRANPGRKIIQSNTPTEIEKALTEFYKGPGAKYKEAAEDFFKYIQK